MLSGARAIVTIRLLFTLIGLSQLSRQTQSNSQIPVLFGAAAAMTILGIWLGERVAHRRREQPSVTAVIPDSSLNLVWVLIAVASAYHLAVVGIPILSPTVEVDRSDFTGSGMLGIPGRLYLFGPSIYLTLATVNAYAKSLRWREYGPFRRGILLAVVVAALSGYKGSLLNIVVVLLVIQCAIGKQDYTLASVLRKYWVPFALIMAYVFAVATTYTTYAHRQGTLASQLTDRLTINGSRPAWVAMLRPFPWHGPNVLINDIEYFVPKYLGLSSSTPYPFTRAISAYIWGIPPGSDLRSPSVTISGYAELFFSFGGISSLFLIFIISILTGFLQRHRFPSVTAQVAAIIGVIVALDFYAKGNIIYSLLNWTAVGVLLLATAFLGRVFSQPNKKPSQALLPVLPGNNSQTDQLQRD